MIRAPQLLILALTMALAGCIQAQVNYSELIVYPDKPGISIQQPPADKANVIFLRPARNGINYVAAIYDGDRFVSLHTVDTHHQYLTAPGKHQFMASISSGYPAFLDAELEGGKTYFIAIDLDLREPIGVWVESGVRLIPVAPGTAEWEQLKLWLAKSYEVNASARTREWGESNLVSVVSKKQDALQKWYAWEGRPIHKKEYGVEKFE